VLLASKCQCITPFSTREGEMVVGAKYTYFFDMSEPYSSLVSTKAPVSSLEATAAIAEGEDPTWAADKRPRKRGQWVGDKSITLQYEDIKVEISFIIIELLLLLNYYVQYSILYL
jgi:hypothetical protein